MTLSGLKRSREVEGGAGPGVVKLLKTSTIRVLKLNIYLEIDVIPVLLFGF